MAKLDDDYVLIHSPLCQTFRQDGISVEVIIYRGEDEKGWILEVVDQDDTSHLWDDQFATDELALKEFIDLVNKQGMKQFNPHSSRRIH